MRRFVAFRKCGDLLCDPILNDGKILGAKARNVVPLLVGHCDVELYHIDDHMEIGALLSFHSSSIAEE
jgi:hypothetical protein